MANNENDIAIAKGMLERLPDEWVSETPSNMLIYFAAQMIAMRGFAKTADYLRDVADIIEKCGMDLEGVKTWK